MKASIGHDDTVMAMGIALFGLRYTPLQHAIQAALPKKELKKPTLAQLLLTAEAGSESEWMRRMFTKYQGSA
jgi:hypothetical protein